MRGAVLIILLIMIFSPAFAVHTAENVVDESGDVYFSSSRITSAVNKKNEYAGETTYSLRTMGRQGASFVTIVQRFPTLYAVSEELTYFSADTSRSYENLGHTSLGYTYVDDGEYYYYLVKISGEPSYSSNEYYTFLFDLWVEAKYWGTLKLRPYVAAYRKTGGEISYTPLITLALEEKYVFNEKIHLTIQARIYWMPTSGTNYDDDYKLEFFVFIHTASGTEQIFYDDKDVEDNDDSVKEYPVYVMAGADYVANEGAETEMRAEPEHHIYDSYALHAVSFYVPYVGTTVSFSDLPWDWLFNFSSPAVTWNDTLRGFVAPVCGEYTVWFLSYDVWNYGGDEARISYHTSRGETLPFDAFHTYMATSPSHLIQYAPDPDDPTLVAWFRFNEGSGTKTYDWAHGLEATIEGGASWVTGYIGYALSFDGVDDHVDITLEEENENANEITVEMWVKPTSLDDTWAQRQLIRDKFFNLQIKRDAARFELYNAKTGSWVELNIDISAGNGVWHHVAGTYDGDKMRLYIDGILMGERDADIALNYDYTKTIWIGYAWGANWFSGVIDEVRIYSRALSAEEIWWHYALVFYYDGLRDLMGRDPSFVAPSGVTYGQGLYGYATYIDGKYTADYDWAIEYDWDESKSEAVRSGTMIAAINIYERYEITAGKWYDIINLGWIRFEWRGSTDASGIFIGSYYKYDGTWKGVDLSPAVYERDNFGAWRILQCSYGPSGIAYWAENEENGNKTYSEGLTFLDDTRRSVGMVERGAFNVAIDELIVLRVPLTDREMIDIYKLGKTYIGGAYTASSFPMTYPINYDSDESGYGLSEDFADISEWMTSKSASSPESYVEVESGYLHIALYTNDTHSEWVSCSISNSTAHDAWIDMRKYPFVEFRWKTEWGGTDGVDFVFSVFFSNGTHYIYRWIKSYRKISKEWHIHRVNILKRAYEVGVPVDEYGYYYIGAIKFHITDGCFAEDGSGEWHHMYVDWIRVYGVTTSFSWGSGGDSGEYVAEDGGRLLLHITPEDDGLWDIADFYLTSGDVYFDADDVVEVALFYDNGGGGKTIFKVRYWNGDLGKVIDLISVALETPGRYVFRGTIGYSGYWWLRLMNHEWAQSPGFGYEQCIWIEYVRIGRRVYTVSGAEWGAVLHPVYEHPRGAAVWFNITDIWGNQLYYGYRFYEPYQDFVFSVYSWKFYNGRDDTFIHINITNGGYWWGEWLAPHEVTEYVLYPGDYTLRVDYPDGSYFTASLTVTTDSYWMLEGDTLGDVLRGIGDVLSNITSVNQTVMAVNGTISDLVVNVNITVNAWSSKINNTVVNISINLNNVNSTLSDMILDVRYDVQNIESNITTQINWVIMNVSNVNSTVLQQINDLSLRIDQYYSDLNNSIISVNISIENYYSELSSQILSVNISIENLHTDMDAQFNWVFLNISNVNTTILQQINNLSAEIYQYYSDLNMSIVSVNVSVNNWYSNISQQLVTIEGYVIDVNSTLLRVNNTLYTEIRVVGSGVNETYKEVVYGVDSIEDQIVETSNMVGRAATETRNLNMEMEEFSFWTKILVIVFGVVALASLITAMTRGQSHRTANRPSPARRIRRRMIIYGEVREEPADHTRGKKKKRRVGDWETIEALKVKNIIREWRE